MKIKGYIVCVYHIDEDSFYQVSDFFEYSAYENAKEYLEYFRKLVPENTYKMFALTDN